MPRRKPKDPERSADLPHNWIERHITRLAAFMYTDVINLDNWQYRRARLTAPNTYEDVDTEWSTIQVGEQWGGQDTTAFFRKTITIPRSHAADNTVLDISLDGGEAQLSINGYPYQGLDWYRSIIPIGEFAQANRQLQLDIEAFIINYPYDERRHDERDFHRFQHARLLRVDREIEQCVFDLQFVFDAYMHHWYRDDTIELESYLRHHLEDACREIGSHVANHSTAQQVARQTRKRLQETVYAAKHYQHAGTINVCGHSHLDIIYLWPIKETFRKNCRTTTNMLSLMREYPEYRYSQSQPYLYEKLEEMHPDVFEEVKQRVKEGRWEIIGAMYVEPDGNLLGAESLVRQLLFGKRYLRRAFGVDTQTCWLPDVFGVMYTLPQILRKSGVKYFTTVKLNIWNDTNDFPYDTFRWRGPDGSEVITHFPPTHFGQLYTYGNLRQHWQAFRERNTIGENLFIYGLADGGGGPTREMVEASLRTDGFPGLPHAKIELAESFFQRLDAKAKQLPVWDDELYLEAHRGTYTTKGELKRNNRKAEVLYRDAEILSSMAWLYGAARSQERLNEGWKHILLNQFHDTLPGTHRPEGVPDIIADYSAAFSIGEEVRDDALSHLSQHLTQEAAAYDMLLLNTLSWRRDGLIDFESDDEITSVHVNGGDALPVQQFEGHYWFRAPDLPALGWTVAKFNQSPSPKSSPTATFAEGSIETHHYHIELGKDGRLDRLYDKINDHEVLSAPGNVFQVFEDDPGYKFSAWDIAYHFEEYEHAVEQISGWEMVTNGGIFAVFRSYWRVLDSHIYQDMWLYADSPRIDFHTRLTWQNPRKLLKVAFPLQVRTRTATYDLPFGNIERPTHRNTSWEQAKFEVCGHKWADLSEGNYGVALLNDCKYGYDAQVNVLRLSLLRSPVRPDNASDIGKHEFTYSLLPHAGNWRQAHVERHAYELNMPAIATPINNINRAADVNIPLTQELIRIDSESVIVEAIKQAEDSDSLIMRTFDSHGTHTRVPIETNVSLNSAQETDLMEEAIQPVTVESHHYFTEAYTPYEIKTHQLEFARSRRSR